MTPSLRAGANETTGTGSRGVAAFLDYQARFGVKVQLGVPDPRYAGLGRYWPH